MDVHIKQIFGSWNEGYVLHKHTLKSTYLGDDERGNPRFETTRSEPGEALFQLKYRSDWKQINPLAAQINISLLPRFGKVGFIVPMPASTPRHRQPVNEVARALGQLAKIPVIENMISKTPAPPGSVALKDLHSRDDKDAALAGRFRINKCIAKEGRWNALLVDDLFDTGATMDAACNALRSYDKIGKIFVAAITWK